MRTFIQVMALGLTLIASYFLVKGTLNLSPKDIVELSSPKWDFHPEIANNISSQYVNTKTGFVLLLLAFIFQMINLLMPMKWDDFGLNAVGLFIALFVLIIIFAFFLWFSKACIEKIQRNVSDISHIPN